MKRRDFLTGLVTTAAGLVLPYEPKRIYSFGEDVGRYDSLPDDFANCVMFTDIRHGWDPSFKGTEILLTGCADPTQDGLWRILSVDGATANVERVPQS